MPIAQRPGERWSLDFVPDTFGALRIPAYPPTYSDNIRPLAPGYPPTFDALP